MCVYTVHIKLITNSTLNIVYHFQAPYCILCLDVKFTLYFDENGVLLLFRSLFEHVQFFFSFQCYALPTLCAMLPSIFLILNIRTCLCLYQFYFFRFRTISFAKTHTHTQWINKYFVVTVLPVQKKYGMVWIECSSSGGIV